MSEAICERPPDSADGWRNWRARIDSEGANQTGQNTAGADSGEVAADIVGLPFVGRKRARHRRRLHDADHGDHQGKRHQAAQLPETRQGRQGEARQSHREDTEHADAAFVEMEQGHSEACSDKSDQGPRNPGAYPRRHHGHDQYAGTEREGVGISFPNLAEDVDEAHQQMPLLPGDAKKGRQLADDDVDRDAGEKARRDRN